MRQGSRPSPRASAMRGFAFEDLVAELFSALGYTVERETRAGGVFLDMVVKHNGLSSPVEVSGRGGRVMDKLIADAARLRSVVGQGTGLSNPILVVGGPLTDQAKAWSEQQFDLRIWDGNVLKEKTALFSDLHRRLTEFVGEEQPQSHAVDETSTEREALQEALRNHIEKNTLRPTDYENICMSVFKHLFDPYLYGFERQTETSDGANRYDFICRILPGNGFWDGLRQDFRTKAVLFECKNYEHEIGPDQVYSTERYLFTGALRTVCLLVSRLGPNAGAIRAAQGAMRESGKLLILPSNQDLIDMLGLKTQEGGPESFLDKKIWDFVISLPR